MKTFSYLTILISLSIFIGCSATIPGGLTDATTPIYEPTYQILGESEGSVSWTYFFGFQTNKPDIKKAISEATSKLGGDDLINVTWYSKTTNYFIYAKHTFMVKGTVIKHTDKLMTTLKSSEEMTTTTPVSESKSQNPTISIWRQNVLYTIKVDRNLLLLWKQYAKNQNLSEDYKIWVNSLTESDFQDYNNSDTKLREWLENKLKE